MSITSLLPQELASRLYLFGKETPLEEGEYEKIEHGPCPIGKWSETESEKTCRSISRYESEKTKYWVSEALIRPMHECGIVKKPDDPLAKQAFSELIKKLIQYDHKKDFTGIPLDSMKNFSQTHDRLVAKVVNVIFNCFQKEAEILAQYQKTISSEKNKTGTEYFKDIVVRNGLCRALAREMFRRVLFDDRLLEAGLPSEVKALISQ